MSTRVRLEHTGWAHDLRVATDDPPPAPGPGQVRVELDAAGVCFRDLIDRDGRFPFIALPTTPGHEGAGRVRALGPATREFSLGDRVATMHRDACGDCPRCLTGDTSLCASAVHVFGLLADGCYARQLIAPESALFAVPESLSDAAAATMHCTFGTAWRAMVTASGLGAGERVLITGANGGVGAAAIQIVKRLGSRAVAVIRQAEAADFVRSQGADEVIVDSGARIHKQVNGIDLALDCVGSPVFNSALRTLRIGGRIAVVGNVDAARTELNLGYLVVNGLRIIAAGGATRRDMAALFALHETSPFEPAIDRILPLHDADRAQRAVRAGGLRGRIVLRP